MIDCIKNKFKAIRNDKNKVMTSEEVYLNQLANKGKVTNNENLFGTMLLEKFQKKQEWKKRINNLMKSIK